MAITNVPAPRQANLSPVLNFMLQMSSLRERKETRKLQARQVAVDEKALESRIGQAVGAGKQSTALAREANARADAFIKETDETFNVINTENRRLMSELKRFGVKDDIIAQKEKSARDREVQAIWDDASDEMKFNIAHADQLGKLATAENRGLTESNNALMQQVRLGQLNLAGQAQQFKQKTPWYTLAGSFEPVEQAAAIAALDANDIEGFTAISQRAAEQKTSEQGRTTGEATTLKQTGTAIPRLIQQEVTDDTEYSSGTLATLRTEQAAGRPLSEVRRIDVGRLGGVKGAVNVLLPLSKELGRKQFQMMTESDARSQGFGSQWDAAGPGAQSSPKQPPSERSLEATQGHLKKPTSVKDRVKTAVSKTSGAKKATTSKQITDSRGWVKFVSPGGVDTWVNPKDIELAKSRGYTLGTK